MSYWLDAYLAVAVGNAQESAGASVAGTDNKANSAKTAKSAEISASDITEPKELLSTGSVGIKYQRAQADDGNFGGCGNFGTCGSTGGIDIARVDRTATPTVDAGGIPCVPCIACGSHQFWCPASSEPSAGPWYCARCAPKPENMIAHVVAGAGSPIYQRTSTHEDEILGQN